MDISFFEDKQNNLLRFTITAVGDGYSEDMKKYFLSRSSGESSVSGSLGSNDYLDYIEGWFNGNCGVCLQFQFASESRHAVVLADTDKDIVSNGSLARKKFLATFFGDGVADGLTHKGEEFFNG